MFQETLLVAKNSALKDGAGSDLEVSVDWDHRFIVAILGACEIYDVELPVFKREPLILLSTELEQSELRRLVIPGIHSKFEQVGRYLCRDLVSSVWSVVPLLGYLAS